ncbi:Receptor-interacting serine/threonine-protein kinase 2, variant 2 [Balamuthia mandrillaris]
MASKGGEDLKRSNTLSLVEAYKQQALLQASSRARGNEPQQQRQASTLGRTSFKRNNNRSSGGGRCHDLVNMFERIASVSSIDTNNGNHRNKNVLARTRSPRDLRKTRRQLLRDSNEDSSCEGVAFAVAAGEEHEEEAEEEEASGDEKTSGLFPLHQLLPQEQAFPSPPPSHRPQEERAQGEEAEQMEETTEQKTEETSAEEENNEEGKSLKREQKKKEEAMLAHVFQNRREQWLTKKDSLWNLLYTSTGSVCKRPQPPPGAASPLLKGATAELLRRRAAMDKKMQQQGHVRRPSNPLTGIVSASGEYEVEEDEEEDEEEDTAEEPVEGKEREVKEEPAVAKGTEGRDKAATETEEDGLRRRKGSMSKRPSSLPPLANAASILGSSASQLSVGMHPSQRRTLTGSLLIEEEVKEPIVVEEKRDVNGESKLDAATTLKKGNLHIEYNYKEIDERYLEIDEDHPIARGAFGIVYKGLWQKTECAVKQLTMPLNNDKALHEFRLEASIMEKLGRHPNVVTFYGALTTGSKMCLVIEYARLGSMYDFLVNRRTRRNDISWLAVVKLLKDAAMGIAFLHRERIIHRDIAARNILVQGPHLTALVSDFGLSRMKSELYSYAITSNTVGAVK